MFKLYIEAEEIMPTMCDPFKGFAVTDETVGVKGKEGKIPNPQLVYKKKDAKKEVVDGVTLYYFEIADMIAWRIAAFLPAGCKLVMVKQPNA